RPSPATSTPRPSRSADLGRRGTDGAHSDTTGRAVELGATLAPFAPRRRATTSCRLPAPAVLLRPDRRRARDGVLHDPPPDPRRPVLLHEAPGDVRDPGPRRDGHGARRRLPAAAGLLARRLRRGRRPARVGVAPNRLERAW